MANKLEKLKLSTTVVADTGDFETGKAYGVQDATTNPSLILAAAKKPQYQQLIDDAVKYAKEKKAGAPIEEVIELAMDKCIVNFGCQWLKFIPGRVSTEIDAHLSFDTAATVKKGKELIALYNEVGIQKERILVKIAATWEGIEAAKQLEQEGIHCNITLLFAQIQAIAAAQNAKVTLISPFVGRILDWHKAHTPNADFAGEKDPGVISVKNIYAYFKKFGLKTVVMGASFRSTSEIEELCGCDLLTISPDLLQKLEDDKGELTRKLKAEGPWNNDLKQIEADEKTFRWLLNEDQCATEKLSEGIRKFGADIVTLEGLITEKVKA